jgi:hypothetical protein
MVLAAPVSDGSRIEEEGARQPAALSRRYPGQAGAIGGLSDTALAVVVGTLTLVGVVGFFQTSSTSAKVNTEVSNMTALVGSIRSAYYAAGSVYTGMTNTTLAAARIAPGPLIKNGDLYSAFGSKVLVVATAPDTFTLTYSNIPADACVRFLTTMWNSLSDTTASGSTKVNNTAPTSYDMTGATSLCTTAANGIVFTLN